MATSEGEVMVVGVTVAVAAAGEGEVGLGARKERRERGVWRAGLVGMGVVAVVMVGVMLAMLVVAVAAVMGRGLTAVSAGVVVVRTWGVFGVGVEESDVVVAVEEVVCSAAKVVAAAKKAGVGWPAPSLSPLARSALPNGPWPFRPSKTR